MAYRSVFLTVLLAAPGLLAEGGGISGPVAGMVFLRDEGALRPMLGVPGSAWLGDPLAVGLEAAAVSPDGRWAAVVREGRVLRMKLNGFQAPEAAGIGAAPEGADRVVWNAESTIVAVLSTTTGRARLWRDFEASGECVLPGAILAAAVDATGALAAGVAGEGLFLCREGSARLVSRNPKISALVLSGRDLYLADNALGQVMVIRHYSNEGDATVIASVEDPVGLAISAAGDKLAVASAAAKALKVIDLKFPSAPATVDLDFTPTGAQRFAGSALWWLNPDAQGPVQLLHFANDAAVYFVPAVKGEQ